MAGGADAAPPPARRDRRPGPRSPARSWCRPRGPSSIVTRLYFAGASPPAPRPRARPMTTQPLTPAMQQYHRMKAEHPDALLFFRMGDFYELFFEDAVVAARALEIALTSRSKDREGDPIPMCGVPHHAVTGYVARLVSRASAWPSASRWRTRAGQGRRQARGRARRDARAPSSTPPPSRPTRPRSSCPGAGPFLPRRRLARRHHRRILRRASGRAPSRWERLRDDLGPRARGRSSSARGAELPVVADRPRTAGGGDPARARSTPPPSIRATAAAICSPTSGS